MSTIVLMFRSLETAWQQASVLCCVSAPPHETDRLQAKVFFAITLSFLIRFWRNTGQITRNYLTKKMTSWYNYHFNLFFLMSHLQPILLCFCSLRELPQCLSVWASYRVQCICFFTSCGLCSRKYGNREIRLLAPGARWANGDHRKRTHIRWVRGAQAAQHNNNSASAGTSGA